MEQSEVFWNRIGFVEIEGYSHPIDGFDIKFDIEKTGDIYAKFKASILGLNFSTVSSLTVWNPAEAIKRCRQISIYGGYKDNSESKLLCTGQILNAVPTSPPEMWLNMDGLICLNKMDTIENPKTMHDTTIGQVFDRMCAEMKMSGRWESKKVNRDTKTSFTFEGAYDKLPGKFAKKYNCVVYGDNNTLVATDTKGEFIKPDDQTHIPVASVENGLISIVGINVIGATIRVRLSDKYRLFSWIELQSKVMPKANGLYYVIQKHHIGHLRGDEWYTELTLIRKMF